MEKQERSLEQNAGISAPYSDLLERTRAFLSNWEYKGILPPEVIVPEAHPGVAFFIANIKLPENGNARIIEMGGLGSNLNGYPQGQDVATRNLYEAVAALDIPVRVITWQSVGDMLGGIDTTRRFTIGYNTQLAQEVYGFHFGGDQRRFYARQAGEIKPVADLRDAKRIIWSHITPENLQSVDRSKYIIVNEDEVEGIVNDKAILTRFFQEHGLEDIRPQAWLIPPETTSDEIEQILADAGEVSRFVLKPTQLTNGRGVELLEKDNVATRLQHLLATVHGGQDIAESDRYAASELRRGIPLVLEEYVASKPLEMNGELYDPTMRIAVMTIVNNGKMTVVPICAQWELPKESIAVGLSTETVVSWPLDIAGGLAEVSDEDFQQGMVSVVRAATEIMKVANTSRHDVKEVDIPTPSYRKKGFHGDSENPVTPQENGVYVLFGRKVRYLGEDPNKMGVRTFNVEFLDEPNLSEHNWREDQEPMGTISSFPEWFTQRMEAFSEEEDQDF